MTMSDLQLSDMSIHYLTPEVLPSTVPNVIQYDIIPVVVADKPSVRRSERQRERHQRRAMMGTIADTSVVLETSCFAVWSTHTKATVSGRSVIFNC